VHTDPCADAAPPLLAEHLTRQTPGLAPPLSPPTTCTHSLAPGLDGAADGDEILLLQPNDSPGHVAWPVPVPPRGCQRHGSEGQSGDRPCMSSLTTHTNPMLAGQGGLDLLHVLHRPDSLRLDEEDWQELLGDNHRDER
jgi:hypothetical protein